MLNVLIPMAGAGKRFIEAGYKDPKPLIDLGGQPMISRVVQSLDISGRYIYLVNSQHYYGYNLERLLNSLTPDCHIIKVDGLTEGAACTTLLAKEYINNYDELIIANSDQFLEWNSDLFLEWARKSDGCIVTFWADSPKWSYVQRKYGRVVKVAEKEVISKEATVGVYYWKRGIDYVHAAEQMIYKNIRTNGEFYVCPTFNEVVDALEITTYSINGLDMHGLGTPEDLENFKHEFNIT